MNNNPTVHAAIRFTPAANTHIPGGALEVICGSMFSGKSEELVRRIRRAKIARQEVIVFKHAFDNERTTEGIISHDGTTIGAYSTDDPQEIVCQAREAHASVIGIDEIQFFKQNIVRAICDLVDEGRRVIIAGLDLDFRGLPFGSIPTLLALADDVTKLNAICSQCGNNAHFTQRLVNGHPARYADPQILVGAREAYQARCRRCYRIDQQGTI